MGFEVKADYSLVNLSRPPSHPLFPYPTGKDFCKHWVHNGFVNIDNEKMSKRYLFTTMNTTTMNP